MATGTLFARHPALSYLVLAFAISWGGVLLVVGPSGFPGDADAFSALLAPVVLAMLAGPSVAGLATVALADGRAGLQAMRARLSTVRVGWRWYVAALGIAPAAVSATLLALAMSSPVYHLGVLTAADPLLHLALGLVTGLAAGLFEELGWTGVAVPALRRRHGVLATGFLVGLAWGVWHLLVVWWGSAGSVGSVSMAIYLPVMTLSFLPPFRILMVWVYDRTQSLFVAMLMHASLTASVRIFDPIGIAGTHIVIYNAALGLVLWAVVAIVWRRPEHGAAGSRPT